MKAIFSIHNILLFLLAITGIFLGTLIPQHLKVITISICILVILVGVYLISKSKQEYSKEVDKYTQLKNKADDLSKQIQEYKGIISNLEIEVNSKLEQYNKLEQGLKTSIDNLKERPLNEASDFLKKL